MTLLYHASRVPASILAVAQQEQDVLCRIFGETLEGEPVDSELGDMRGLGLRGSPKLFSYVRYDAELSREGLDWLGLPNVQPAHVQPMDAIDFLAQIRQVAIALPDQSAKQHPF